MAEKKMKAVELDVFHHDCVGSLLTEKFPQVSMTLASNVKVVKKGPVLSGYQIVVDIRAPDAKELEVFLKALKEFKSVTNLEVWAKKSNRAFALLAVNTSSSSYEEIIESGAMYFAPCVMAGGYDVHSIVTTDFRNLKSILNSLEDIGEIKIKKIGTVNPVMGDELLTDKQVDALRKAISFDYYSWPRKVGLEFLAKQSNLSRRAYQEHLRKAESKLFPELLKDYLLHKSKD
jgi:predicted DNA binding protein